MGSLRRSIRQGFLSSVSGITQPPHIILAGSTVVENTVAGTLIGNLFIYGGFGTYTWSLLDDAGGRVDLASGGQLVTGETNIDYEDVGLTGHAFSITVEATPASGGAALVQSFSISVSNALEVPVNTVSPTITGTATEGQILGGSNGTWSGSPTSYSYRWFRDNVVIAGSVNATRVLTSADVGHKIRRGVKAINADGTSLEALSPETATVDAASVPIPVNTAAPVISGSVVEGQTLTLDSAGTWTNSPTLVTHQWRRNGVDIAGATGTTYVTTSADVGASIVCREFASNAGGTAAINSNSIGVIVSSTLPNVTLTGSTIIEGSAAGTVVGTVQGAASGATVTLQDNAGGRFALNGSNQIVAGSTATNYESASSHNIVIRQVLAGAVNTPHDTTLAITVTDANEAPTGLTVTWRSGFSSGSVSETTGTGTVLADLAGVDPDAGVTFTFSKQADADSKFTVTGSTLVLSAALDYETKTSHSVTIRVTDQFGLYFDQVVTVTVTDFTIVNSVAPTVTGAAYFGTTLGLSLGSWTGADTFTYQWRYNGATILGATSSTYSPTFAQEGGSFDCVVTGHNTATGETLDVTTAAVDHLVLADLGNALITDWDAKDTSTITTVSGNVSAWASRKGSASANNGTAASRPPYVSTGWDGTMPTLTGDGLSSNGKSLSVTANIPFGDYWWFIIAERATQDDTNTTSQRPLLSTARSSGGSQIIINVDRPSADGSQTNIKVQGLGAGSSAASVSGFTAGAKALIFASIGAALKLRLNGGSAATGAPGATTTTQFGIFRDSNAARTFAGKISHIACVDPTQLPGGGTDAERQKIEGALAWRWGLQANLATGHPYKDVPPPQTGFLNAPGTTGAYLQPDGAGTYLRPDGLDYYAEAA